MTRLPFAALGFCLAVTAGCASKSAATAEASATPVSGPAAAARTRNTSIITASELAESGAQNLYQAVQILRPQWLRARPRTTMGASSSRTGGGSTADATVVYLDQTRYGGLSSMQQLTLGGVQEMRFYDGVEATNRFGTGHTAGAIVIRMSKQ